MLEAQPEKELIVRVGDDIGVLHDISKVISERGLNILATTNWVEDGTAHMHLLTSDHRRAMEALRGENYNPQEREVVVAEVDHRPGILEHITERLARERINLEYLYSSTPLQHDTTLVVFDSSDNQRSIVLLNEEVRKAIHEN